MRQDDGAVAVTIALMMLMLIGFAAIAVDAGALYQERRELQNGADAAAMAAAQDCALGLISCSITGLELNSTVDDYANANANDAASSAAILELNLTEQFVEVETETLSQGNGFLTHWFAWAFDHPTSTVRARAKAKWASIGSTLGTLPLTISQCEFDLYTAGGTVYAEEPFDPALQQIIDFHDGNAIGTCVSSSSGMDIPGGFGWLTTDGTSCNTAFTAGSYASEDPGSSASTGCDSSTLQALLGTTVLIPIFDEASGLGSNGQYHIYGFAAFYLTSFRLGGSPEWNGQLPGYVNCQGSRPGDVRCIGGHFTSFVDLGAEGDLTAPDLGATTVQLIE